MSKAGGKSRRNAGGRRPLLRPVAKSVRTHQSFRDRRWAK